MVLYIDTTDNDLVELALVNSEKFIQEKFESLPHGEKFATEIKNFLQKKQVRFDELQKIAVNVGPGFFSRVRTGVIAANALAFALKISVVSVSGKVNFKQLLKTKGQAVARPIYGKPASVTQPKKP